jgi:hypothetical protein
MQELYEGIELTPEQTEVVCRGLLDLASVDGTHDSEMALIADFSGGADLKALEAKPFDLDAAARVLTAGGDAVVEAFLTSAFLLIYADGDHSERERARIGEYGEALGVSADRLESLHTKARLYLLQILAANLRNKAAVRDVAAEMGLSENDLAGLED